MFFSIHQVKDIMPIRVEWTESEPKQWKVSRIYQESNSIKNDIKRSPELEQAVKSFDILIKGWIDGIIQKIPDDLIDFNSQKLTENQLKVLKTLMTEVPRGNVITYKDLAIKAGLDPNSSRFVGNTMHLNYWPLIIPCHRVVKADLSLGNFSTAGGAMIKEKLLKEEGVSITNNVIKSSFRCK